MVTASGDRAIQRDTTPIQSIELIQDASADELASLLQNCANGDESSLAALYRATSAPLFAVLLRALKVHSFAEEALQRSYISIWHRARDYRSELGKPMTWLLAIARTEARSISTDRERWQDLPEDASTEKMAAAVQAAGLTRLDDKAKQYVIDAWFEGATLQSLSEVYSEPAEKIREKIRSGLRLLSERDNESA